MSGGMKELQVNTRERAISTDINRLQKFKGADIAEMQRLMMNVAMGFDDLETGGGFTEVVTTSTPLAAEIVNGGMVRPVAGTLTVNIDKSVMYAVVADGAADDSVYKYIRDPGTTALAIPTNVAGVGPRIDIIECEFSDDIVETDNRDIFDSATGLFAAAVVTKARAGSLNYRVRSGVVSSGMPALVEGWLPLAVVSLPAASSSVDTMTFWDVRPLVSDREFGMFNITQQMPRPHPRVLVNTTTVGTDAVDITLAGIIEGSYNGRRVGGRLRTGVPGADTQTIVLGTTLSANFQPGIVLSAGGLWYLYFLTPFGLPRWARYTATGTRVPRNPRGIPVLSTTPPTIFGTPSSGIVLPTLTGLGSTAINDGICLLAGFAASVSNLYIVESDGDWQYSFGVTAIAPSAADNTSATYALIPGTHFPANARELILSTDILLSAAADFSERMWVYRPADATIVYQEVNHGKRSCNAAMNDLARFKIGVPSTYPTVTAPTLKVEHYYAATAGSVSDQALYVVGWRF